LTDHDLRAFVRRLETTFAGRCARSFLALQGIDRALVLASQAFTALIPLLLLVAALAPADHRDVVSKALIGRFRLSGDAADAVSTLFAHPGSSPIGFLSGSLLVFSGVSLTRRMQRMYQQAWGLQPRPGVGHAVHAALGLTTLLLGIGLLYLARALVDSLPMSGFLLLTVSAVAGVLLWTSLPWLLLDRRVAWRRLAPTGALTTVCTSAYGVASTIYMPRLLETYSRRYGLFGVTLALVGWLLAIAFIVVAATVVAAEFDRAPDPWARRLRRRFRIEGATAEVGAPEAVLLTRPLARPETLGRPQTGSSPTSVDPSAGVGSSPEPARPTRE
jgi:uncharacterized BrkB/YihY/UPF0761 family membrane protein